MTLRQIIQDMDKQLGRSDDVIDAASKFASKAVPGSDDLLDREVPAEEIESVKQEIRNAKKQAEQLVEQFRQRINTSKN